MSNIGGNITGVIQLASYSPNASGEQVPTWKDALRLTGFLDMMSGSAGYMAYNAKIQESTHVFIWHMLTALQLPEHLQFCTATRFGISTARAPMSIAT